MSVLVHAEIDGERLDDDALLQESLLILVGGDETTRHVISGGMYALLAAPRPAARACATSRGCVPIAVEEMLRWVTPIQNMNRTATRDVELRGQQIRDGDKVLLLYPSANRDERVFAEPHRFDVGREPNPHVAFGGYGAHFCLGASLARLELRDHVRGAAARHADARARQRGSAAAAAVRTSSSASNPCRCGWRDRSRLQRSGPKRRQPPMHLASRGAI